jgi:hypothetical protein
MRALTDREGPRSGSAGHCQLSGLTVTGGGMTYYCTFCQPRSDSGAIRSRGGDCLAREGRAEVLIFVTDSLSLADRADADAQAMRDASLYLEVRVLGGVSSPYLRVEQNDLGSDRTSRVRSSAMATVRTPSVTRAGGRVGSSTCRCSGTSASLRKVPVRMTAAPAAGMVAQAVCVPD